MTRLQALFDDSGNRGNGRFMVVAGLMAEAKLLNEIKDTWDRCLRSAYPGSIRYFKMHQATHLKEEFRGWEPARRDDKVRQLAEVIDRADLTRIWGTIDLQAFERVAKQWGHVKGRHSLRNPNILGVVATIAAASREALDSGSSHRMEIIFHRDAIVRVEMERKYPGLFNRSSPEVQSVMPLQLLFEDDEEGMYTLLQASDLIAGEMRLKLEGNRMDCDWIGLLCLKMRPSEHNSDLDELSMQDLNAQVRLREFLSGISSQRSGQRSGALHSKESHRLAQPASRSAVLGSN